MHSEILLRRLEGGCLIPLGAWARREQKSRRVKMVSVIASPDGKQIARGSAEGSAEEKIAIVEKVEQQLREAGAETILKEARSGYNPSS